jgi:hypothetical protein
MHCNCGQPARFHAAGLHWCGGCWARLLDALRSVEAWWAGRARLHRRQF